MKIEMVIGMDGKIFYGPECEGIEVYKWEFTQGCQTQTFLYDKNFIQKILDDERKADSSRKENPLKLPVGKISEGGRFWANIERLQ